MALPAPIAYWPFNEASGTTIADASGNGHTATVDHGTWDTVTPRFGSAALKNTDGGKAGTITPISLGTTYTIAFWMNGWDGANDGVIADVYLNSTGIFHGGGTWTHGGLTGAHHLVLSRTGASATVYKDGVALSTSAMTTASTVPALNGIADGTSPFVGSIDEVRLYDVALTAPQAAELYTLNPDPLPPGPAPIVTGTSSAGRSLSSPLTFAHTAAGDVLFVATAFINSGTVISITYGGAALTRLDRAVIATYDHEWWYLNAPTPGTANVVITVAGPVFELCGLARNVSGLSLGRGLVSTAVGTSAALSLNVPSVTKALVLDFLSSPTASVVFTVGGGQTLNVAQDGLTGTTLRCAASSEPGAVSVAMSWTFAPNATVNSSALSVTRVVGPGEPIKAKLGNKHTRTDENGSVKVTPVTAGSGTSPLTPFANIQVATDDTGALKMGVITLNPPLGPLTDLANLRVCTDENEALLVAINPAGSLLGPLTNLGNIRARTDARGSLVVTSVAAGSLQTPLTPTLNLRGRTDENGALVVTGLV